MTVFMVVQAALAVLLSRLGAGTDIPVGTAVAGRTDAALDDLVGFFVNTLVIRTDLSGDPEFGQLLAPGPGGQPGRAGASGRAVRAAGGGAGPGPVAGPAPAVPGDADRAEHRRRGAGPARGARRGDRRRVAPMARFDLYVAVAEAVGAGGAPAGLRGVVTGAADLFDAGTVAAIAARLVRVLDAVTADPGLRVSGVDVLDAAERDQLLAGWNDTAAEMPPVPVPQMVAGQAARAPDAVAVASRGRAADLWRAGCAGGPAGGVPGRAGGGPGVGGRGVPAAGRGR